MENRAGRTAITLSEIQSKKQKNMLSDKTKLRSITVGIGSKGYDLDKEMPIPRIGEKIRIEDSGLAIVTDVQYKVLQEYPNNDEWIISIYTKKI